MNIQPLSPDSIEDTVTLAATVFPDEQPETALRASIDPLAREDYLRRRGLADLTYWVAQDDRGDVAGVTGMYTKQTDPETSWIGWFGVDPEKRRQGIGSELLDTVIEEARRQGRRRLRLYTSSDPNEAAAQVLYEDKGFRVINEVPDARQGFSYLYRELALDPETETQPMRYELVTDPDDPRVVGAHKLMGEIFDPAETDPLEVTQTALRDGGYIMVIGKEEGSDDIIAVATGKNLPLPENQSFLCGCYIAAKEQYRRIGIGLRLFQERLSQAMRDAEAHGQEFLGYLSEGSEAEEFFNRVYGRRMYVQTSQGVFEEIPYYQPPTEWNTDGSPMKTAPDGSQESFSQYDAPEHLVFAPPPGINTETLAPDQLMGMIRSMFSYNSRENASSALERVNAYVNQYENELEVFLRRSCDGIVHLISARQRKQREVEGVRFIPHPGITTDAA